MDDFLQEKGVKVLHPFIKAMMKSNNFVPIDNWIRLLDFIKSGFPSLESLNWTSSIGNDLIESNEFMKSKWFSLIIDFVPTILNKLDTKVDGYQNLGVLLRESATYHHGNQRVVCDRNRKNIGLKIDAQLELYDSNRNRIGKVHRIGNNSKLIHEGDDLDYTDYQY